VETTTVPATSTTAAEVGVEVTVAESALGLILVDGEGRTLYLFTPDAQGTPTCVDACANTWPPLVGTATAGEGVDGTLLGTIARADGSEQVTHNGWPLYRYSRDSGPGDTNGQGFNDVWFVVSPTGEAITG
jgi:predicted lipoprotein with Yx(FWY)xxD motif